MKEGTPVMTPEGEGVIVKIEKYSRETIVRYCVKLEETLEIRCFDRRELRRI